MMSDLKKYENKYQPHKTICVGSSSNMHQFEHSNYRLRVDKSLINKEYVRYHLRKSGPLRHVVANNYIPKVVNNRWSMGIPMTVDI